MSFNAYLLSEVKVSFHQDFEVDFHAVNETVQDECWPMQNYWSSLGLKRVYGACTGDSSREFNSRRLVVKILSCSVTTDRSSGGRISGSCCVAALLH
jgi:hypothetical protein